MTKGPNTIFVCQNCGHQSRKWLGKCPECGEWNSLVEERVVTTKKGAAASGFQLREVEAIAYTEIESQDEVRISSGVTEFDRVLGGGIVPGTLVLIGGDPGIGKSTLLLQVADKLSASGADRALRFRRRVGTADQTARRATWDSSPESFLLPETNLENIFHEIERLKPERDHRRFDSDGFLGDDRIGAGIGLAGEGSRRISFSCSRRTARIPVFLIGHITKDGSIAGPRALEHIVDTVLYFEGERHHNHRIVRATKNRFGAANEVGVFEMTGAGLMPVANPSQMFLQERPQNVAGSVVTACMEGTRPMLVEIQALVSRTKYGTGRRMTQGVDQNRVALYDRHAGKARRHATCSATTCS